MEAVMAAVTLVEISMAMKQEEASRPQNQRRFSFNAPANPFLEGLLMSFFACPFLDTGRCASSAESLVTR